MKNFAAAFLTVSVFIASLTAVSYGSADLQQKIEKIAGNKKAVVGVAVIGEKPEDELYFNNDRFYPMQSTYKFHLALYILNLVDKGKLSLDDPVYISKKDLLPDTYSPLRDKYPQGNINISLGELLEYAVSQSDNNGCDILFRLAGGTAKVNKYIQKIAGKDIYIAATEEEMRKGWGVQYSNRTTPSATALLLDKFYKNELLSRANTLFLTELMTKTATGAKRIKALLPEGTVVIHKTGSGPKKDGVTSACNDIGIVLLAENKHFTITVYVTDSKEEDETNEAVIAAISKAAFDYFTQKAPANE